MTKTLYKWTVEDYHKLVDYGLLEKQPVELLDGEIVYMSPEGVPHRYITSSVADYLRDVLADRAYISEAHPITLDNSEPQPDVAIVRLPKTIYKEHHPYPEDIYWLIEVSDSTLSCDLGDKAQIYARNGIQEYWVLDVKGKQLSVFRHPTGDRYGDRAIWKAKHISPLSFPDLELEVATLFN
jgi:Uma2 family endonuclease